MLGNVYRREEGHANWVHPLMRIFNFKYVSCVKRLIRWRVNFPSVMKIVLKYRRQ